MKPAYLLNKIKERNELPANLLTLTFRSFGRPRGDSNLRPTAQEYAPPDSQKVTISTTLSKNPRIIKKFRASGDTKKLADTYVRAGMYNEAIAEYSKLNTLSAMNNMGMVYSAQKSYKSALGMYNKVLAKDPDNKSALAGSKKIKALIGE